MCSFSAIVNKFAAVHKKLDYRMWKDNCISRVVYGSFALVTTKHGLQGSVNRMRDFFESQVKGDEASWQQT